MGRKTRVGIIAAGIIVLASTVVGTSYYFVSSHYANRQKADSTESGQVYVRMTNDLTIHIQKMKVLNLHQTIMR